MRFVMDLQPRFDYARRPHKLELSEDGADTQGLQAAHHGAGTAGPVLSQGAERRMLPTGGSEKAQVNCPLKSLRA